MSKRAWNFKDLTGQRFGRLLVTGLAPKQTSNNKLTHYFCRCDCGKEKIVGASHLPNGSTASCGCLRDDTIRAIRTTHGRTDSAEYSAWCGMKDRCYNPKCEMWYRYGKRGIKVCNRWLRSFENFFSDIGPKPSPKHSVERINNNGNYETGNVKWGTVEEQVTNKSNNVWLTLNGVRHTTAEWSRITGLSKQALSRRHKDGWTDYEVLTTFAR